MLALQRDIYISRCVDSKNAQESQSWHAMLANKTVFLLRTIDVAFKLSIITRDRARCKRIKTIRYKKYHSNARLLLKRARAVRAVSIHLIMKSIRNLRGSIWRWNQYRVSIHYLAIWRPTGCQDNHLMTYSLSKLHNWELSNSDGITDDLTDPTGRFNRSNRPLNWRAKGRVRDAGRKEVQPTLQCYTSP